MWEGFLYGKACFVSTAPYESNWTTVSSYMQVRVILTNTNTVFSLAPNSKLAPLLLKKGHFVLQERTAVALKSNHNCSRAYLAVCSVILALSKKLCKVNETRSYGTGVRFVNMSNAFSPMRHWMLIITSGHPIRLTYKYLVTVWSFNILKAEENGNIKKKHSELVQRQQQVKSMISLEKISSFAVLNINKIDSWFWVEGKTVIFLSSSVTTGAERCVKVDVVFSNLR